MKYGTVINCMDGRVQYPVMDYLRDRYRVEVLDAANEAGPLKILCERSEKCRVYSLKEQIRVSLGEHGSRLIVLAGHHDRRENNVPREVQVAQPEEALEYLERSFGNGIAYTGLYVNDQREVEEVVSHPEESKEPAV